MHKKGISLDSVEKSLSHSADKIPRRTLMCFEKIRVSKIFKHRRGGITVLSKFFVSQDRNEKLCKGTLLFSEKFLVSKKFMDKRGHITIFSRNFYVSQSRKFSWGNPTVFEKISGSKKFHGWKGGYHVFPSKIFGLTVPKNFVKEPVSVSLISDIEKC